MGSEVGHFANGSKNVIFPQVLSKTKGFMECLQGSPLGGWFLKGISNILFIVKNWLVLQKGLVLNVAGI